MSWHPFRSGLSLSLCAAVWLTGASVNAHVVVDSPNGGEILRVGSKYTIRWHIAIQHVLLNWDVWYSTTGANGPWIPLAMDLPASARSYEWNVWPTPFVLSNQVPVRVRMDSVGMDYYDISDQDLRIAQSLSADVPTVSVSSGGVQVLAVNAGRGSPGYTYWILGTLSGTMPGARFGGFFVPFNPDSYTEFTLAFPNSPLMPESLGVLVGSGRAGSRFILPPGLDPSLVGRVLHHSAFVFGPGGLSLVSQAVSVTLVQ